MFYYFMLNRHNVLMMRYSRRQLEYKRRKVCTIMPFWLPRRSQFSRAQCGKPTNGSATMTFPAPHTRFANHISMAKNGKRHGNGNGMGMGMGTEVGVGCYGLLILRVLDYIANLLLTTQTQRPPILNSYCLRDSWLILMTVNHDS
jgi:hypothetical protein